MDATNTPQTPAEILLAIEAIEAEIATTETMKQETEQAAAVAPGEFERLRLTERAAEQAAALDGLRARLAALKAAYGPAKYRACEERISELLVRNGELAARQQALSETYNGQVEEENRRHRAAIEAIHDGMRANDAESETVVKELAALRQEQAELVRARR